MEQENKNMDCCGKNSKYKNSQNMCGGGGAVYGLGVIGAGIYFIQHANTFWMGVLGILKAIVWPAFIVFKLLELFKF